MAIYPFIRNRVPAAGASGISPTVIISFDLLDEESDLKQDAIQLYVDNILAYDGQNFQYPYNSPGSSIAPTIVDGYDGYHLVVDSYGSYNELVPISLTASDSSGNTLEQTWAFLVGSRVNVIYFSDGYGLKAIKTLDFVGECQSEVRTIATVDTTPELPSNEITDIFGNFVRDNFHLVISYDGYDGPDGYGAFIL